MGLLLIIIFVTLQRLLSDAFTDNLTNLGSILSDPVAFFVFTDLSVLIYETVASFVVIFSSLFF